MSTKKTLFLFLLVIIGIDSSYCQSSFKIESFKNASGKNLLTDSIIFETEYLFKDKITNSIIDSTTGNLTIQLTKTTIDKKSHSKEGSLLLFNLNEGKVIWDRPIDYSQSSIDQFGTYLIERTNLRSKVLDFGTGNIQFEIRNSLYHVDYKTGIGFGYNYNFPFTPTVEAIDLKNGKECWERTITREYGWNSTLNINDSTLLLSSDGLHSINIKNGKGWDFQTKTGRKDYSTTIAANFIGFGIGLLTGNFVTTTGHDILSNLVSNILTYKNKIYFTSKDKVSCLNMDGNELWKNTSAKKYRSNAIIFAKDSTLYIINKGTASYNGRHTNYGKPFIEAINLTTGADLYNTKLIEQDFEYVDYAVQDSNLVILTKNKIDTYFLSNGNISNFTICDNKRYGSFTGFASNQIYLKNDSNFINLIKNDSSKIYVTTSNNQTIQFNKALEIENVFNNEDLYLCYYSKSNLKFLARGEETIVIDSNKVIAEFKASRNAFVIGNKLFEVLKESVIEVDLSFLSLKN